MVMENKSKKDMSVEEILKSIKGVIENNKSDDPKAKIVASSHQDEEDDILELIDIVESEAFETAHSSINSGLVSNESVAEVSDTLRLLAAKTKSTKDTPAKEEQYKASTIEELAIELLKPQLKEWLDNNLPALVKQIVEKEIQRLIPKEPK